MKVLQAAQFIYTRVEPNYSPVDRSGYQIVHKPQGLSSQDVSAAEQRVQCYRPGDQSVVRYQFFPLPSGALALVRSKVIPTDPVINDKDGRSGVFMAHGLIFSPDDLRLADFQPFLIFDRFRFVDSAEEMVREFGQATGRSPIAQVQIEANRTTPTTMWRGEEIRRLVALAAQAKQLTASGRSVQLVGRPIEIDEALRITFLLLPRELRPLCSFDTCVEGCMTLPGLYWAIGSSFRESSGSLIDVDAKNRRLPGPLPGSVEPDDLYFAWLGRALALDSISTVLERAPAIQHVASSFTEGTELDQTQSDDEAIQEFLELHESRVHRAFQEALCKVVGERLAGQWQDDLWNRWPPRTRLATASQRVPLEALSAYAGDWLQYLRPDLPDGDWKRLQNLARASNDALLLFLSSVLSKKLNEAVQQEALRRMDSVVFRLATRAMPKTIPPAYYVSQEHLAQLLSSPQLTEMSAEQLVDLIDVIVGKGYGSQLSPLSGYVSSLDSDGLARFEKLIRKNSQIPPDFVVAVSARRQQLGEASGLFGRIKSRLPGGPNER